MTLTISTLHTSFTETDFCVKGKKSDSHLSKSDSHSSKSASHSSKSDSHSSKSNSHSSPSKDAGGKIKDKGTDYCTKREPCGECYGDCDVSSQLLRGSTRFSVHSFYLTLLLHSERQRVQVWSILLQAQRV